MNKILKALRMSKGFTQKQVADLLHISRPTYTRYETGERKPDYETIKKISFIFNVSTDYLIGIDKSMRISNSLDIYKKLVEIGFLYEDEEVTDAHLKVLSSIVSPQIEFARYKLKKENNKKD